MSDAMARALGAGAPGTVEIGGKICTIRPLGMRELTEIQREALDYYRKQYLRTFAMSLEFMPDKAIGQALLEKKIEEAARWDIDNLPKKVAYDGSGVNLTEKLRDRICEVLEITTTDPSDKQHYVPVTKLGRMVAAALDQELLTAAEYTELTGSKPPAVKIPYDSWWITGCFEGMITFAWKCFAKNGVTRDEVLDALGSNIGKLTDITRDIEKLSQPSVGNG